MAISHQNNGRKKEVFYTGVGLIGMLFPSNDQKKKSETRITASFLKQDPYTETVKMKAHLV